MIRIFNVAVSARVLTLALAETAALYTSFLLACRLDPAETPDILVFLRYEQGFWRISLVVALILLGLYFRDLYSSVRIRNWIVLAQELCMIFGIAYLGQGLIDYVSRDLTVPRRVMMLGGAFSIVGILFCRILFDRAARDVAMDRVLFLGMSPTVTTLADHLRLHPEFGLAPAGYLSMGADAADTASFPPRLGASADLDRVIEEYAPTSIAIARRSDIKPWWTEDFLELNFGGVSSEEAGALYERTLDRVCISDIWPGKLVFSDAYDPQPLDLRLQSVYTPAAAIALLPFALPAIAVLWAALRLTGRPAMRRDTRIGLNGKPFRMFSFRAGAGGFGRFLRRTGLTRLPELFNVLSGDMAFVGPRPERPEFHDRLCLAIPFYPQRNRVKPGLTSWAEIHSDSGDTLLRLEYDLYYAKHLSPSLDGVAAMLALKKAFLPASA